MKIRSSAEMNLILSCAFNVNLNIYFRPSNDAAPTRRCNVIYDEIK